MATHNLENLKAKLETNFTDVKDFALINPVHKRIKLVVTGFTLDGATWYVAVAKINKEYVRIVVLDGTNIIYTF